MHYNKLKKENEELKIKNIQLSDQKKEAEKLKDSQMKQFKSMMESRQNILTECHSQRSMLPSNIEKKIQIKNQQKMQILNVENDKLNNTVISICLYLHR